MPSVLVVEDDEAIADVIAYQLTHAGHAATVATDGLQALQQLRSGSFDLMILDLMLPRLSGLEVLRALEQQPTAIPVIVLSARDSDADQISALELGADDYVTKPFSIRQLLARVAAVLRRARPPEPGSSVRPEEAEVVIDAERHEVRKRGDLVPLAPKEFELLLYLARHANQVCSRDTVLNAVWGYGYEGETRTVDVHVHWIRRKLEDDPAKPRFLVTVRQYGYKLVAERPEGGSGLLLIEQRDPAGRREQVG